MTLVRPLPIAVGAVVVGRDRLRRDDPQLRLLLLPRRQSRQHGHAPPRFRAPQVTAVVLGKASGGATRLRQAGRQLLRLRQRRRRHRQPGERNGLGDGRVKQPHHRRDGGVAGRRLLLGRRRLLRTAVPRCTPTRACAGRQALHGHRDRQALNAASLTGSATVDNTPPRGCRRADDQRRQQRPRRGRATRSSSRFSEPIEPASILAGWNGTATNVVVRLNDNGLLGLPLGNDSVQIWNAANSAALPLGTVDLGRSDYVAGLLGGNVRFGASGTASTMTMSGSTVTSCSAPTTRPRSSTRPARTAGGNGTATWTPVATPYDRAENTISTTAATESGAADREF